MIGLSFIPCYGGGNLFPLQNIFVLPNILTRLEECIFITLASETIAKEALLQGNANSQDL